MGSEKGLLSNTYSEMEYSIRHSQVFNDLYDMLYPDSRWVLLTCVPKVTFLSVGEAIDLSTTRPEFFFSEMLHKSRLKFMHWNSVC